MYVIVCLKLVRFIIIWVFYFLFLSIPYWAKKYSFFTIIYILQFPCLFMFYIDFLFSVKHCVSVPLLSLSLCAVLWTMLYYYILHRFTSMEKFLVLLEIIPLHSQGSPPVFADCRWINYYCFSRIQFRNE